MHLGDSAIVKWLSVTSDSHSEPAAHVMQAPRMRDRHGQHRWTRRSLGSNSQDVTLRENSDSLHLGMWVCSLPLLFWLWDTDLSLKLSEKLGNKRIPISFPRGLNDDISLSFAATRLSGAIRGCWTVTKQGQGNLSTAWVLDLRHERTIYLDSVQPLQMCSWQYDAKEQSNVSVPCRDSG